MTGSSFIGEHTVHRSPLTLYAFVLGGAPVPHFLTDALPFSFLLFFSSVVPDFLVQTGDKTGTGSGGESFFGGMCAACFILFSRVRTGGGRRQNSLKMRFIHVYDLRIVDSSRWRTTARRTRMIHSSSSRSVRTTLTSYALAQVTEFLSRNDVDRADELHGKHTLFGRCVGDTIYSASFITSSAHSVNSCLEFRCHED